ncbi:hypothetical protein [Streptomyces sp. HNM0574]|nr:hypothetical protein [Streptomyces sp. HNM0574]
MGQQPSVRGGKELLLGELGLLSVALRTMGGMNIDVPWARGQLKHF